MGEYVNVFNAEEAYQCSLTSYEKGLFMVLNRVYDKIKDDAMNGNFKSTIELTVKYYEKVKESLVIQGYTLEERNSEKSENIKILIVTWDISE